MPRVFMDNTDLVSAGCTRKDVSFYASEVDLTGVAGTTPSKICCTQLAHNQAQT